MRIRSHRKDARHNGLRGIRMLGLVSISFRGSTPAEIIAAVKKSGLDAIEWGGDIHVPHGDVKKAAEVCKMCKESGISIPEYGSYYIIGQSEHDLYKKVAESCHALESDCVRVWALQGKCGDTVDSALYEKCVADAAAICDEDKSITVCLECHPMSLTDEYHNTLRFLRDVGRDNLKMFWQPNQYKPFDYNADAAAALKDYVKSVHTFSWDREHHYPLEKMEKQWSEYISILGKDKNYMLEFMHDGKTESLDSAAKTLRSWFVGQ